MSISDSPSPNPPSWSLLTILQALPERELVALIQRTGIRIDQAKRIDVRAQMARALLASPEARDPSHLPLATRELLYRIAEAGGTLIVPTLPASVQPLLAKGLVYARALGSEAGRARSDGAIELVLPVALYLQLKPWEGEDPRGLRALLTQTSSEVALSIASYYLGKTATHPVALSLETAWTRLSDPDALSREVFELAPLERKLLRAIEEVGGEVDTAELLDLEREPFRLRNAAGATHSRRGVGFALERRGFLIPIHPNRHVIPSEVARVVGAHKQRDRELRRGEIRTFVLSEDHAPNRAVFSQDPAAVTLAISMALREMGLEIRPNVGIPRSLIHKLSLRFGQPGATVSFLSALSRAAGLWDVSAVSEGSPIGALQVDRVGGLLLQAWRRGGVWDESHPEGEMMRLSPELRDSSVIGVVREMVLDALGELAAGRWVPWEAIAGYIRTDARAPGLTRLVARAAGRAGHDPLSLAEIARRIVFHSLHLLGVVDLGDLEEDDHAHTLGPTLRVTQRGRQLLETEPPPTGGGRSRRSEFIDGHTLRVGGASRVCDVLSLAPAVEVAGVTGVLDLAITPAALSRALAAGLDADWIQVRLEALAPIPDPIARVLVQASAVLGRLDFVECQGFLWVEDSELRDLLLRRRQTADLFVDPSPPSGLLVAKGVDFDRLLRRCRAVGVEVSRDGIVCRTRGNTSPVRRPSAPPDSSRPARREGSPVREGPVRKESGVQPAVVQSRALRRARGGS